MNPQVDLRRLESRMSRCRECPRLVARREEVARTKRRRYLGDTYWGKPVAGFGDPDAPLLVVGLAPGAHGANRTGRVFTGDRSGDFLYSALHRAGLASQPTSEHRDDGLVLRGVWVTLAARCVPPDNRPLPEEVRRCGVWLRRERKLLAPRAVLVLGAIAWDAWLDQLDVRPKARPKFAHGAELPELGVIASYHVSQQNTQTGRLTETMFDAVLRRAKAMAGLR